MKRLIIGSFVWLVALMLMCPLITSAQESPRSDPTASAPDAAALPPKIRPTSNPATRPEVETASSRFASLFGMEGYWRIGRDHDGIWWFVTPDGHGEFLNTVTTVQPYLLARDRNGADYVSANWNSSGDHDVELEKWAKATLQRVYDAGFKGLGAWSHPVMHKHNVPMTRDLNVWTWLQTQSAGRDTLRLYHPDWAKLAESTIQRQVEPLRENRALVGYYVDNELDWSDATAGPAAYFDELSPSDPNRAQVTTVIKWTWNSIEKFNGDWGTDLKDFADLDAWRNLPRDSHEAYRKLGSAWLSHLAKAYWKTTTELVRKHDPNHLILGSRYRGSAPWEVVAASKGLTDAQSLNYYVSDAKLDPTLFKMLSEQSGQPLILSEYGFHSLDGRSGNRNTVGFPGQVLDQKARAEAYKLFTSRLARVPYVIGADWFQWMDEPPTGRRNDGEDVNFGVVDIDDRAYPELVEAIRATTPTLNGLHEKSGNDKGEDVWRDSFEKKPTIKVPYLTSNIRLNGELRDWPASARLSNLRATRSVGHDRAKMPEPNVYLGYTTEGLYVGLEVFDHDVATAPPTGWWWSRDSVEFFVSTQPVASDQVGFDDHCHHFFFIPTEFPWTGVGGVVGQWFAPGSAIKANQIPHPEAKSAVRVLPDRYVAEIFIPGKSLTGWNPTGQPQLAFNVHVRNYQHAAEYYWSAPKLVLTQARPTTWGIAALQPKDAPAAPLTAPIAGTDGASAVGN